MALVGRGNNGADALYAAARLAEAGFSAAAVAPSTGVHAGALADAEAAGVLISIGDDPAGLERIADADVVLDGVFGIGGRSGLPDWARRWVDAVGEDAYLIAVDVPSGQDPAGHELDADGGVRRRDGDVLGGQAGPPPAAHRAGRRSAHGRRHRPDRRRPARRPPAHP